MKNVDTVEKLKKKMTTSLFWANEWIISVIERLLNIKFIILDHYRVKEHYNVLHCGLTDIMIQNRHTFEPEYYILMEKYMLQYKLVGYKEKQIFKFQELPYDLRKLVAIQCLECQCTFSLIDDFKHFAKRFEKQCKKNMQLKEDFCDSTVQNMYDPNIVFEISSFASTKALPGRASRETIREENLLDFYKLHSFEKWRFMLHDSWLKPFKFQDHFWNSVTHCCNANKFITSFPKYYLFFTAESGTPLSKDAALAIAAGSQKGQYKNKLIRPNDIHVSKKTFKDYRQCLLAKFEQNSELEDVLLSTKNAKLVYFKKGKPPKIADDLMVVRNILQKKKNI
jgi:predicted NAD-dependent protein-ADP-ribosyltransferase YbiA (DUF1768 family)